MADEECKDGCAVAKPAEYRSDLLIDTANASWTTTYLHCFCIFAVGVAMRPVSKGAVEACNTLVYLFLKFVPRLFTSTSIGIVWNTLCVNYGVGTPMLDGEISDARYITDTVFSCLSVAYLAQKKDGALGQSHSPQLHFEYYRGYAGLCV